MYLEREVERYKYHSIHEGSEEPRSLLYLHYQIESTVLLRYIYFFNILSSKLSLSLPHFLFLQRTKVFWESFEYRTVTFLTPSLPRNYSS